MTPFRLIETVSTLLENSVENWELPAEPSDKKVSIYRQFVPAAEFADDSFYPLICVEFVGLDDDVEFAVAQVLITVATYDGDSAGWQDHLNLAQNVRQTLLKNQIIGEFALQLPLSFGMAEKTEDNFTFSNFLAVYRLPSISAKYF